MTYVNEDERIKVNVIRIVADHTDETEENIKIDNDLVNDLCADSLDIVEMTMDLEEFFDIEVSEEEIYDCTTVQNLIDLVKRRQAEMKADGQASKE